jgi:gamma-glutamylcyclotransferase (GGCT)/AIG2-like uncharacterized protein YtfP
MANHGQLAGCPHLGSAELTGFALYDLGPFPMAIASGDPSHRLHGELYAVTPAQLQQLDRFEGAPRLYQRTAVQLADGRRVWMYLGRPRQVRHVQRIASGRWLKPPPANAPPGPGPSPGPRR